jgi:hypothetical protein
MGLLTTLRGRLRRRPVDPERALRRAQAEAHRQALRQQGMGRDLGSSYGGAGDGL